MGGWTSEAELIDTSVTTVLLVHLLICFFKLRHIGRKFVHKIYIV